MSWETPAVVEINMSAEIGAYQGESDDDSDPTLRTEPASTGILLSRGGSGTQACEQRRAS